MDKISTVMRHEPWETGMMMGKILMTLAAVLASGSAMASSIDIVVGNRTGNGSIISVTCQSCPPVRPTPQAEVQQSFVPGTQEITVRDVEGKKQTVRREAWLGGSPVTFVSNNPAWLPPSEPHDTLAGQAGSVDTLVKTSAVVTAEEDQAALPLQPDASATLALEGVMLRPSQP